MPLQYEIRLADILAAYFSVPLFVSSVYGMNIALPLQNESYTFLLYVALCVVWAVIVTLVGLYHNTDTVDTVVDATPTSAMQRVPLRDGVWGRPSRRG